MKQINSHINGWSTVTLMTETAKFQDEDKTLALKTKTA